MNPRQFLLSGGVVLLLLGIVGYAGVFSDTKSAFYLDAGENVAHTILGVVAIAAMILTTEALVTDLPEKEKAPAMPSGGMDY